MARSAKATGHQLTEARRAARESLLATRSMRANSEQRIVDLEELIVHMWIHSGYPRNGYMQMTTEQKTMYDEIVERDHDFPIDATPPAPQPSADKLPVIDGKACYIDRTRHKQAWYVHNGELDEDARFIGPEGKWQAVIHYWPNEADAIEFLRTRAAKEAGATHDRA